jgi:hypothetical protein
MKISQNISLLVLLLAGSAGILLTVSGQPSDLQFAKPALSLSKTSAMSPQVNIKVGESALEFAKRYAGVVKTHSPAPGTEYYAIDWDRRPRGIVKIDHGAYSFLIEDVLGVSSLLVLELASEGLSEFDIFAGVTDPDLIDHDEARIKTYAILKRILDAGWKQVIERSEPRLMEKARQDYMFATSSINGLDARYVPSFEDWMRIESNTPWSFYADGLFMEVNFTREPTLTDPAKPGSYLLSFNIKTAVEYYRGYAGPENRAHWKELLPAALAQAATERARRETELRAKGIQIDTSYQDPPLPNLE